MLDEILGEDCIANHMRSIAIFDNFENATVEKMAPSRPLGGN